MDCRSVVLAIHALAELHEPPLHFHKSIHHLIARNAGDMTSQEIAATLMATAKLRIDSEMLSLHLLKNFLKKNDFDFSTLVALLHFYCDNSGSTDRVHLASLVVGAGVALSNRSSTSAAYRESELSWSEVLSVSARRSCSQDTPIAVFWRILPMLWGLCNACIAHGHGWKTPSPSDSPGLLLPSTILLLCIEETHKPRQNDADPLALNEFVTALALMPSPFLWLHEDVRAEFSTLLRSALSSMITKFVTAVRCPGDDLEYLKHVLVTSFLTHKYLPMISPFATVAETRLFLAVTPLAKVSQLVCCQKFDKSLLQSLLQFSVALKIPFFWFVPVNVFNDLVDIEDCGAAVDVLEASRSLINGAINLVNGSLVELVQLLKKICDTFTRRSGREVVTDSVTVAFLSSVTSLKNDLIKFKSVDPDRQVTAAVSDAIDKVEDVFVGLVDLVHHSTDRLVNLFSDCAAINLRSKLSGLIIAAMSMRSFSRALIAESLAIISATRAQNMSDCDVIVEHIHTLFFTRNITDMLLIEVLNEVMVEEALLLLEGATLRLRHSVSFLLALVNYFNVHISAAYPNFAEHGALTSTFGIDPTSRANEICISLDKRQRCPAVSFSSHGELRGLTCSESDSGRYFLSTKGDFLRCSNAFQRLFAVCDADDDRLSNPYLQVAQTAHWELLILKLARHGFPVLVPSLASNAQKDK